MLTAVTITEVSPNLQKRKDQELFSKAETLSVLQCECVWVGVSVLTLGEFVPVRWPIHQQIWQVYQKISQVSYKTNTANELNIALIIHHFTLTRIMSK